MAIAAIGYALAKNRGEMAGLLELHPAVVAAITIGALGEVVGNGMVLKLFAGHLGNEVSLKETVLIGLMDTTLNYLPMKAGTIATGAVLKVRYTIALSEYAALVAGNTVLNLWACALTAGGLMLLTGRIPQLGLALVLVPTAVFAGLLAWGGRSGTSSATPSRRRLVRIARRIVSGLREIFADRRLVVWLASVNAFRILAAAFQLYWAFRAVSTSPDLAQVVIVASLGVILTRFTFLPGGLGLREGGIAGAAAAVGLDPARGLAASVIDRIVRVAVLLVLGLPATFHISRTTRVRVLGSREEPSGA